MTINRFESFGVYLPEKEVTTPELVDQMGTEPMFDLQRLTGIKSRRWRAEDEDSVSLAMKAIENCLARSNYKAEDIDVIICTAITRFQNQDGLTFVLEPGCSNILKQKLGMRVDALNFDITNACAGMFTGVTVLDQLLKSGAVKTGLVVSGECITPIAETALKEISNPIDDQFASLTVGDSGAAVIMDAQGIEGEECIDFCEMMTLSKYSDFCYGMPSEQSSGVAMYTKAMEIHGTVIQRLPPICGHYSKALDVTGMSFDHIIPHQTSKRAILTALDLCTQHLGELPNICVSLDRFGNTSSTSHFVVMEDYISRGEFKPGQRLLMMVLASGIILGLVSVRLGKNAMGVK